MHSFGYPAEGHYVVTEDKYKLRLDRIPNEGKQPVYLAHGFQTGAPTFVLGGETSLGEIIGSLAGVREGVGRVELSLMTSKLQGH